MENSQWVTEEDPKGGQTNSLSSAQPQATTPTVVSKPVKPKSKWRWVWLVVVTLFISSLVAVVLQNHKTVQQNAAQGKSPKTQSINLSNVSPAASPFQLDNSDRVVINGQLNANQSIVLKPNAQPTGLITGQLYVDKSNSTLYFYDGKTSNPVSGAGVPTPTPTVISLQGQTGAVSLVGGTGVGINGTTISNTGVISVQGQTGNISFSAGAGLGINGTTFANTGVLSFQGQTGNVSLAAGSGVNISGTSVSVDSSVARLNSDGDNQIFTGNGQIFRNSGDSATGFTVQTASGTQILTVDTGANQVVFGQAGTINGKLSVATAGNGTITIVPASTAGNFTITLPNSNGTVCLDSGNCSSSGANAALSNLSAVAINTSLLPGSPGVIHLGSGTLPFGQLYLSGTSGTPGTNNFLFTGTSTGGTRTLTIPDASGTLCLSTQNCLSGAGGGAKDDLSNLQSVAINTSLLPGVAGTINLGSATMPFGQLYLSGTSSSPGTNNFFITGISTGGTRTLTLPDASGVVCLDTTCAAGATKALDNLQGVAINTSLLPGTAGSVNLGSGSLPFGKLSLSGTSSSPDVNNFLFTGASTGGLRTITIPDASGTICLDTTACGGGGGGGGANTALSNLSAVAINTSLIPGSATGINLGSGSLPFSHLYLAGDSSTPGTNNFLITGASSGGLRTITIPDASGTICLDTTACGGGGGGGGANTSLSNLSAVGINTSLLPGVSNSINVGSSSFLFQNGYFGTGLTTPLLQSTGALTITPGGLLTVGTASQTLTLQGDGSTSLKVTSGGFTNQLVFATPGGGNKTLTIPNGTGTICISAGNCLSGAGGGAKDDLSNLQSVAINTSLLPGNAGTVLLGSGTLPFGQLYLSGTSGTPGTNNFLITGVSTGGLRTITIPDASGTLCLNSQNCLGGAGGGAKDDLSNLQSVAINTSLLPGSSTIDIGTSSGTTFRSGYFNTGLTTPLIQSTGTLSITPGGTLTVGANGQTLVLQGDSSTSLTANAGLGNANQLKFAAVSGANTVTIPNETGTICTTFASAACVTAYTAGIGGTGTFVNLQNTSPGVQQIGSLNISGTGILGASTLTPILDTPSSSALTLGNTTATAINIGNTSSNITTTITGQTIIKPSSGNDISNAFQIQNAAATQTLLSFDTTAQSTNFINTSPTGTAGNSTFTNVGTNGWAARVGTSTTVSRVLSASIPGGAYNGEPAALKVVTTGGSSSTNDGASYTVSTPNQLLAPSTSYALSLFLTTASGGPVLNDIIVSYQNGGVDTGLCSALQKVNAAWTQYTCSFTTGPGANSSSNIYVRRTNPLLGAGVTFYIDNVELYKTTGSKLVLGDVTNGVLGQLQFASNNGNTLTIQAAPSSPGNFVLTLPAQSGTICTDNPVSPCSISADGTYLKKNAVDTASASGIPNNGFMYTFTNLDDPSVNPNSGLLYLNNGNKTGPALQIGGSLNFDFCNGSTCKITTTIGGGGTGAGRSLTVQTADAVTSGVGGTLGLVAGAGAGNSAGGVINLTSGSGSGSGNGGGITVGTGINGSSGSASGTITLQTANATGNGAGGAINLLPGNGAGTGAGGAVSLGAGNSTNGAGGAIGITAGNSTGNGVGGAISLTSGNSAASTQPAGAITIQAGSAFSATGAPVSITGGSTGFNNPGGAVSITGGAATGTGGSGGAVILTAGLGQSSASGGTITIQGGTASSGIGNILLQNSNGGKVGIGTNGNPSALLSVGTGSAFTVDTSGNVNSGNITAGNVTGVQGTFQNNGTALLVQDNSSNTFLNINASTGAISLGGTTSTGTVTLGRSTATYILNIGNATTATGNTQTINIGANATGTGKSVITIGNTNGASQTNINAGTGGIVIQGNINSNLTFATGANRLISVATPAANTDGNSLTVRAANGGATTGQGGNLFLNAGITIDGNNGVGGNVSLTAGSNLGGVTCSLICTGATGSQITLLGGNNASGLATGGDVSIQAGIGGTDLGGGGRGGNVSIIAGNGTNNNGAVTTHPGNITIDSGITVGGGSNNGQGGSVNIGNTNAGSIAIGNASLTAITIQGNATSSAVVIQSAASGTIAIGNNAVANTVNIAAASGANNTTVAIGSGVTGGSNSSSVTIGSNNASGSTTLIQGGNGATAIQLVPNDNGSILIGGATQTGAITVGRSTASQTINIGTGVTAGGATLTIHIGDAGAASSTTNLTLGSTQGGTTSLLSASGVVLGTVGTANNAAYLCRNASNIIAACSGTASGASFVQGGNAFGGTATLGTTDNNGINIRTNSATVASLSSIGAALFKNSTNSSTAYQFQTSSGVTLLGIDTTGTGALTLGNSGGVLTVNSNSTFNGTLVVNGNSTFNGTITIAGHVISGGTALSGSNIASNANCGTGCTVSISGNDTAGIITINTGTSAAAGTQATITFANAYGSAPTVVLTPKDVPAGSTYPQYYYGSNTTTFDLKAYTALTDSKTYTFSYHILQ
ncbi:MAG TPA: hypothetical protein VLF90_02570 [Patescibacteria group bacterium]|nr:hypothetical protein [Patescibacteria group bacterium]